MSSNSKKVLIVDDDEVARRLLRRLLQRDYCLAEATTGEQALEIFPVFLPDLLTLDIMMPGIEGPKVCRLLRSNRFGQRVPVIIVSAEATREDKARA